ncbi:MAG TPA: response regulator, partial [Candidatus Xenobia bacterium]|jgi:two-component system sensor histidine kinase and response regulator WspE
MAGKAETGRIVLSAFHRRGALSIELADDGQGIDAEDLRAGVVARGLSTLEVATHLSVEELYEFLFLPGFSTRSTVSEFSGRGVGLDAVQTLVQEMGGRVSVESTQGRGTTFLLDLPLTLSVVRTLICEIGGEPYAFPLAKLSAIMRVPRSQVQSWESKPHVRWGSYEVPVVWGHLVLDVPAPQVREDLDIVVLGAGVSYFGIVVDRLVGQQNLVVQPLDPRLGKVQHISSGALLEDGAPVLILDTDDLSRGLERYIENGGMAVGEAAPTAVRRRRVLVVDDSVTVREVERKLLERHGYEVQVAFDGIEGWNALRHASFDLVVTDIDMPRMDGFQLLSRIRQDPVLKARPVIIMSYKDRDEDRLRGLELGADAYLTKGAFQDEGFIRTVQGVIGEAEG